MIAARRIVYLARTVRRRLDREGVAGVRSMLARARMLTRPRSVAFRLRRRRLLRAQRASPGSRTGPVSVVVPVYNHFEFLPDCIESILTQEGVELEVLLVDDASTDARVIPLLRAYVAADSRVRLVCHEQNLGPAHTLNDGITQCTGDVVAFVDCDDMLPTGALSHVAGVVAAEPDVDFWFTDRLRIDAAGRSFRREIYSNRPDLPFGSHRDNLMVDMIASHLKVVRRTAFARVGVFDASVDHAQDYDLALRLSEAGRISYVPGWWYLHRFHDDTVTLRASASMRDSMVEARRRAAARRGAVSRRDQRPEVFR